MGKPNEKQFLIAELSHQINSPLAAIRNAIYLAGRQTEDPAVLRYLQMADDEISAIVVIMRATRAVIETVVEPETAPVVSPAIRRAAA